MSVQLGHLHILTCYVRPRVGEAMYYVYSILCSTAQLIHSLQTDHPNGSQPNLIINIGPVYYRLKYFVGIIVDNITEASYKKKILLKYITHIEEW